jgi:FkbM family methyltransferase
LGWARVVSFDLKPFLISLMAILLVGESLALLHQSYTQVQRLEFRGRSSIEIWTFGKGESASEAGNTILHVLGCRHVGSKARRQEPGLRARSPMIRSIYRLLLERYRKRDDRLSQALLRAWIGPSIMLLERWRKFSFPVPEVGGWWWVQRFRFEILMNWFEYESVRKVRQIVRPGMVAVDIGAHLGYYTRLLSALVGPHGKVLAFEPHPENYALLMSNLPRDRYQNVELLNCAVGDINGEAMLYLSEGHSNHSLIPGYADRGSSIPVECVTLDSVLDERGLRHVDFVKSDTEGGEPKVLAGMDHTLQNSPSITLLLEINPTALRIGSVEPEDLFELLRRLRFEIEPIEPDPFTEDNSHNVLCRKPT